MHFQVVMVGSGSTDVGVNRILQQDRFGGGDSLMVWAEMGYGRRTQLVVIDGNLNAQKYRGHVLAPHTVPCLCYFRQRQTSHRP